MSNKIRLIICAKCLKNFEEMFAGHCDGCVSEEDKSKYKSSNFFLKIAKSLKKCLRAIATGVFQMRIKVKISQQEIV